MKGVYDMEVRMATPDDREELARVFHEVDRPGTPVTRGVRALDAAGLEEHHVDVT